MLRAAQFPEDAGPLAHPVRPDSYMEIANFYTATVYNKGAELIRMLHTLLGPERFRAGTDLYFDRHDGQAVTCEDFVRAMEEASGEDLSQFRLWYEQAGTPRVTGRRRSQDGGAVRLRLEQEVPPTPGQPVKQPMPIPLRVALFGETSGDEARRTARPARRGRSSEIRVRAALASGRCCRSTATSRRRSSSRPTGRRRTSPSCRRMTTIRSPATRRCSS